MHRVIFLSLLLAGSTAYGGPYASTAIYKGNSAFVAWATGVTVERGPQDISNPGLGYASYGSDANALGPAEGTAFDVVSLGDGGAATLTFANPITNGAGYDFAVFENGFSIAGGDEFLELAFVEVSSDGINFFGFESVSLTATNVQVVQTGGMGSLDATDIYNLAGKYQRGYGTPFDLEELKDVNGLLDVNSVTHVRIIDVVGYVEPADFSGDGIVNFIDYGMFFEAYLSEDDSNNWNEDCDIFRLLVEDEIPYYDPPNGFIDMVDFHVFTEKWLVENEFSSCDSIGHQINDPWPTPFHNSGFDLDAVGVINEK